jgi:integrase
LLMEGIDPIEARNATRHAANVAATKTSTLDECAEAYIAAHQSGWRNAKHADQWKSTLKTYVSPVFGSLPVDAVDTDLVMKALGSIWTKKPETATRLRGRIESVLDWAKVRGLRTGENPARWRGHLDKLLPRRSKVATVVHHPALPYSQMAEFMTALRKEKGIAALALEFAILTAARTGEVIGAQWSEVDLNSAIWTVPASRMKARREHRVPLSARCMEIVTELQKMRGSEYLFPGGRKGKPLSNMALLAVLRRMKRSDLTAHGFRSTFRDWAAEQTNYPREVAEMALAHTVGDKVEAAYRRGDMFEKRRHMMEAWRRFCDKPETAKTGDNVVAMYQPQSA